MSATGTPKASEDAVAAVQDALGCSRDQPQKCPEGCHWCNGSHCSEHGSDAAWTERGCPLAVAAADAAAPHIAAQTLEDYATEVFADRSLQGLARVTFGSRLRERSDRIKGGE